MFSINGFILQLSSGTRGLTYHLLPYFMCASSGDSGETKQMYRLIWALAAR